MRAEQISVIVKYLSKQEKNGAGLLIGAEFEYFVVDKTNFQSVSFYGETGVESALKKLLSKGYEPIYEAQYVVGLIKDNSTITLEPGCQLEISLKPAGKIYDLEQEYKKIILDVITVLAENNQALLAAGYRFIDKIDDIKIIPKKRYHHMYEYFKSCGCYAHNMMKQTASMQVTVDYSSENDFRDKLRILNTLSPIFYAFFDNAPLYESKIYPHNGIRAQIWDNCDDKRCGIISNTITDNYSYEDYAKYILNQEIIFNGTESMGNTKFSTIFNPDDLDLLEHGFSMVFPDVRIRKYIEIRMIDALPYPLNFSVIALFKGLLYNEDNLNQLIDFISTITLDDVLIAKKNIKALGVNTKLNNLTSHEIVKYLTDLAATGLNTDERKYLHPLYDLLVFKRSPQQLSKTRYLHDKSFNWSLITAESLMGFNHINEIYINLLINGDYLTDYHNTILKVNNSNAIYKGKPVPFLYHPMFFTEQDINNFNNIVKTIISIGNKVTDHYLASPEYRKLFNFSPVLEELILLDHNYQVNVPIARFDIFYNGQDFKFCEFNTDGSSAMNEDNTIARILLEEKPLKDLSFLYELEYFEAIEKLVDETLEIYKTFSKSDKKPTIAIVDFIESATTAEFEEFKKVYEKKGYKTFICDIRNLSYQNGKLFYKNETIDLIYRRAVTREIIDHIDEVKDFIQAYKDQAVCVIGSLKSQILHNKIIFKILHDETTLAFLNENEKAFIKAHIPYTNLFEGDKLVFNDVLNNKDKYIIKPLDLYGSRGVYTGRDHRIAEWEEILKQCFNNDYIYQEYVYPYERSLVEIAQEELMISRFKCLIGLFIYNEKFSGMYTRVGKNPIISDIHGYYTIPNIYVKSGDKVENRFKK